MARPSTLSGRISTATGITTRTSRIKQTLERIWWKDQEKASFPKSSPHSWISADKSSNSVLTLGDCSGSLVAFKASTVREVVTCAENQDEISAIARESINPMTSHIMTP